MLNGSCHCGAVKLSFDGTPKALVRCNCSICVRLGTLWGHGTEGVITVTAEPDATLAYVWGDKELAFHTCKTCGCTTHWIAVKDEELRQMAMNMALVDANMLGDLRIRHFDGANTWEFTD
jgi:hypothetical protein